MSATNAVSARLIGAIFLERGLVTEDQLQAALAIQVETKEHLGEILVQHFGVSRIELASVLAEQWAELERANPGAAEPPVTPTSETPAATLTVVESGGSDDPTPGDDSSAAAEPEASDTPRPLGEILTEQGLVTDAELDRALETQRAGGEKLGEILVAQGSITRLQLASALAEQWTALRKIRPPSNEPPAHQGASSLREAAAPAASPAELERLRDAVAALEQRLRVAESVATREPWREEIAVAAEELRSSVAEMETRLVAAEARDEPAGVEDLQVALADLGTRVEALATAEEKDDPELVRRVEAAAEAAEAAKSSLDGAFESLSLRLADVEARVHDRSDLTVLQSDLRELAEQVAQISGAGEDSEVADLRGEVQRLLDEVTRRSTVSAEPDPALAKRVEKLTVRVEEIGTAIQGIETGKKSKADPELRDRLGALTSRIEKLESVDTKDLQELRRSVSELEARAAAESPLAERLSHYGTGPDDIIAIQDRLTELESRAEELAGQGPALEEKLSTLVPRVEALEENTVDEQLAALHATVDELVARPLTDPALAQEVARTASGLENAMRTSAGQTEDLQARVEALAAEVAGVASGLEAASQASSQAESVRADVEALGTDVARIASGLEDVTRASSRNQELQATVEALAGEIATVTALASEIDAVRSRLDELGSTGARIDALERGQRGLDELSESLSTLEQRIDALAEREVTTDVTDELAALARRLETVERSGYESEFVELRQTVAEFAARPSGDPALAQRVEELAREVEVSAGVTPQLEALGARVGELARQAGGVGRVTEAVDELRRRVDELVERPAVDPPRVERLEQELGQFGALSARVDALGEQVESLPERLPHVDPAAVASTAAETTALGLELTALRDRLEAVEQSEAKEQLDEHGPRLDALERRIDSIGTQGGVEAADGQEISALRARIEELEAKPAGDPAIVDRVEELASRVEGVTGDREQLDRLRARLDVVEEVAASERLDEQGPRFEALERSLQEAETERTSLDERVEAMDSRLSVVDELPARLDALVEQIAAHESGHAKNVRKADLTALRNDLAEQIGSMEERFDELASGARNDRESLERKIDEIAAALTEDAGSQRNALEDRVGAIAQQAQELGTEVAELREAAAEDDAWRTSLETDLQRRIEKLGKRIASNLPAPPTDVSPDIEEIRAELALLAERVEGGDAATIAAVESLKAQLDERLEAGAAHTEAQLRATEDGLQAGLSSLGARLADAEATYAEAGEALRDSIERLGEAIAEGSMPERGDDVAIEPETAADPVAADEPRGPFLAFVPNGSGYSLQELNGFVPVIGEPVPVPERAGDFIVTRIGRSPLPSDPRRCAYLELRAGALTSTDRVP